MEVIPTVDPLIHWVIYCSKRLLSQSYPITLKKKKESEWKEKSCVRSWASWEGLVTKGLRKNHWWWTSSKTTVVTDWKLREYHCLWMSSKTRIVVDWKLRNNITWWLRGTGYRYHTSMWKQGKKKKKKNILGEHQHVK